MEQKSRTMLTEIATNTRLGDINAYKIEKIVKEVLYDPENCKNGVEYHAFRS